MKVKGTSVLRRLGMALAAAGLMMFGAVESRAVLLDDFTEGGATVHNIGHVTYSSASWAHIYSGTRELHLDYDLTGSGYASVSGGKFLLFKGAEGDAASVVYPTMEPLDFRGAATITFNVLALPGPSDIWIRMKPSRFSLTAVEVTKRVTAPGLVTFDAFPATADLSSITHLTIGLNMTLASAGVGEFSIGAVTTSAAVVPEPGATGAAFALLACGAAALGRWRALRRAVRQA